MKFAYSYAQMRKFDERETSKGTPVAVLMERAGHSLASAVKEALARLGQRDAVFVCGGGNNGGDGFVAAERLREEGYEVAAVCLAETFSDACLAAKMAYGGEILQRIPRRVYSVTVDCLFGTGLSRPPEGKNADLVHFINSGRYVIACDIPTGLAEGGIAFSPCVRADETVCMGQLKTALILSDGADTAGKISVADIGIPAEGGVEIWEDADVAACFPKKKSNSNKGDYGSVAILAGQGPLGAPLLAVGAALKSGAGYTEFWLPPVENRGEDEMHRTVLTAKYPAMLFHFYSGEPLHARAVAFGMGAGVGPAQRETVEKLLLSYDGGTLVLDADALNTLAAYHAVDLLKEKRCPVVITPHPKEFSRLTGRSVGELLSDPVGAAKAFSKEYGVTVVFKNNRTVIAEGDRAAINPTGSPVLAKGGSGDVLSGLLAGTAARGIPPFEAAVCACYVLGRAGEFAAEGDEYSPDATDAIACLPRAIASLTWPR